jgi:hypothetical protein
VWQIFWLSRHICGVPQNPLAYTYVNVINAFPKLLDHYLQIMTKLFASGETLTRNPTKRQTVWKRSHKPCIPERQGDYIDMCIGQYTRGTKARNLLAKNRELATRNTNHVNDWILV